MGFWSFSKSRSASQHQLSSSSVMAALPFRSWVRCFICSLPKRRDVHTHGQPKSISHPWAMSGVQWAVQAMVFRYHNGGVGICMSTSLHAALSARTTCNSIGGTCPEARIKWTSKKRLNLTFFLREGQQKMPACVNDEYLDFRALLQAIFLAFASFGKANWTSKDVIPLSMVSYVSIGSSIHRQRADQHRLCKCWHQTRSRRMHPSIPSRHHFGP